jgi:hypothetical protein
MGALDLADCHRRHRWCKVLPKLQQSNTWQWQLPCHSWSREEVPSFSIECGLTNKPHRYPNEPENAGRPENIHGLSVYPHRLAQVFEIRPSAWTTRSKISYPCPLLGPIVRYRNGFRVPTLPSWRLRMPSTVTFRSECITCILWKFDRQSFLTLIAAEPNIGTSPENRIGAARLQAGSV